MSISNNNEERNKGIKKNNVDNFSSSNNLTILKGKKVFIVPSNQEENSDIIEEECISEYNNENKKADIISVGSEMYNIIKEYSEDLNDLVIGKNLKMINCVNYIEDLVDNYIREYLDIKTENMI